MTSPRYPHAKQLTAFFLKLTDADGRSSSWLGQKHFTHSRPLSSGTSQSGLKWRSTFTMGVS